MSDRSSENMPSFELPAQPINPEQLPGSAPESRPSAPETTGSQPAQSVPVIPPVAEPPQQLQAAPSSHAPTNIVVQSTPSIDTGLAASDADLIEKEWVDKAKEIVNQTQDDPFIQKNEISKVKAEYIQKRFKKTLPAQESGA